MKEKNHFKDALDGIDVPFKELDAILLDAFKQEKKHRKLSIKKSTKYIAAVAGLISLCIISSLYVSPTFAQFVTQIPIIGQAFDYFKSKENYYVAYEEVSTEIGLVENSNGIDIIIEKALYDGNRVILSFVIQSDRELGEFDSFENLPSNYGNRGYEMDYVEGVGYVGLMRLLMEDYKEDKINVEWIPEALYFGEKKIEGDWEFRFSLEKIEGTHQDVYEKVSQEGVTVEIIEVIKTDVNLTVIYSQDIDPIIHEKWKAVEAELSAVDNLGNHYKVPYNGGTGTKNGDSSEDITWNATIHGLDPEATSITFYPFAHVSNSQVDYKRIDFDTITIVLK